MDFSRTFDIKSWTFQGLLSNFSHSWTFPGPGKNISKFLDFSRIPGPLGTLQITVQ